MSVSRIASRYAKSLFDLAMKDGKLEKVHEDILMVRSVARNKEFTLVMKNPLISTEKKEGVFNALFKGKVEEITLNTLMVMAEHGREIYLRDICRIFHFLYNQEKHISRVTLTTAVEVGEETTNAILAEFKAKGIIQQDVELHKKVDPSILGGFILHFADQVYNSSISSKLDQLNKKFSENLYIKNF